MKSLIVPPVLKKGDKVSVVALASKLNREDINEAVRFMENEWGLEVLTGNSVGAAYHDFAGTDILRAKDFQQALDDSSIKAIFSARGGYGSSRIIDKIDFSRFRKNPKWVVGFSDITAVHSHLHSLGYQSLHAPMPKTFFKDVNSLKTITPFLFGADAMYSIPSYKMNRCGVAEGQITGGNLCLLAHLIGSGSDINWENKILFLEDVGEYLYNIDRMMVQLKRAGKLEKLNGLIAGSFNDLKNNDSPFGKDAYEIIEEHVADYDYPVCYGFPVGHDTANWALACGRRAKLHITENEVRLSFASDSN